MSIQAAVDRGVAAAMGAIGDLKTSAVLIQRGTPGYDPATGQTTGGETRTAITGLIASYNSVERATSAIEVGDIKYLVEKAIVPVEVSGDDGVELRGALWSVVRVTETADALLALQLRRKI